MTKQAVLQEIDSSPMPGLTSGELARRLHCHEAVIRNVLAELVFTRHGKPPVSKYMVTCDAQGRHFRGDPAPLYAQGAMR